MYYNILPIFHIEKTMSNKDISDIGIGLQVPFPEDFMSFLSLFGAGIIGLQPTDSEGFVEIFSKEALLRENSLSRPNGISLKSRTQYKNEHEILEGNGSDKMLFFAKDLNQNQNFAFCAIDGGFYVELPAEDDEIIRIGDSFVDFLEYLNPYFRYPIKRTVITGAKELVFGPSESGVYLHPFYPTGTHINAQWDRRRLTLEPSDKTPIETLKSLALFNPFTTMTINEDLDTRPSAALEIPIYGSWIVLDAGNDVLEALIFRGQEGPLTSWLAIQLAQQGFSPPFLAVK